jgi:sugar/nucleoside kinase (ribokinase family)
MSGPGGDPIERGPVVCVGAHMQGLFMHVERIPREGESVRGWGFREPLDGGKVANVAVAAARLGVPVRLVTVIGTDARSTRWLATFEAEGVDTKAIIRLEGPMDVGPALIASTSMRRRSGVRRSWCARSRARSTASRRLCGSGGKPMRSPC